MFTRYQKILIILILVFLCTVPVIIALTDEPSQTVQPLSAQATRLVFQNLDLEIPANQLSYHDPLLNGTPWLQTEAPGYTKVEETYDLSNNLLKRVNTTY